MSNVYIDAVALLGPGTPGATGSRALLEAARACGHLRALGHRVILVGVGGEATRGADGPTSGLRGNRPVEPPDGAVGWLLSGDPSTCERARRERRLRTVLVGPWAAGRSALAGRSAMERPADIVARDLADAVLTVMTTEAMPPAGNVPVAEAG